ncbi:hypothetical protein FACS18942_02350 [Planctomycetales bacterium]|nr:hypothetical protein FACS18942_02350 [Planctomycetales bacterium]GHT36184.1 hypothetical protein FACS189427_07320 [Planctomycetales bacterium]
MQCTNHLKQIGLAIHNFHDTYQALPPMSVIGENSTGGEVRRGLSIWVHLYPFVEQPALYDYCKTRADNLATKGTTDVLYNNGWFNGLDDAMRKSFGSVSVMRCPTRRTGGAFVLGNHDYATGGPQSDYAVPMAHIHTVNNNDYKMY